MACHLQSNVFNMNVKKFRKESIKVFMEYGLFEINDEKMIIFLAQLLSENL